MSLTQAELDVLNSRRDFGFENPLGDIIAKKKGVLVAKYDFAKQGGAVGDISLLTDLNSPTSYAKLPDNAIITNVVIDIVTAMASTGGAATVALKAQSAGDLLAAVDADTLSAQVQGIPNGAVANMIKLTAERTLKATVAVEALTAGKFVAFVEFVISE